MRAFIALEPPEMFVDEVAGMARVLGGIVEGRFVPRENYHITLAFLGDVDDATARQAMGVLDEACAGAAPVRLTADGLGKFGRASDATLWLGIVEDARLMELAAAVREGLASCGISFDSKPFKPHITLTRRARIPKASLPSVPFPEPAFAARVTLFRSTLDRQGAAYKPLYTVERGGFSLDPSDPYGFNAETLRTMDDAVTGRSVSGPFDAIDEMFAALEED